ncbi:hypothetical protein A2U01_0092577, partial [Trifolium medium]|nr:hypothetical protein [Trifolium medium]
GACSLSELVASARQGSPVTRKRTALRRQLLAERPWQNMAHFDVCLDGFGSKYGLVTFATLVPIHV